MKIFKYSIPEKPVEAIKKYRVLVSPDGFIVEALYNRYKQIWSPGEDGVLKRYEPGDGDEWHNYLPDYGLSPVFTNEEDACKFIDMYNRKGNVVKEIAA